MKTRTHTVRLMITLFVAAAFSLSALPAAAQNLEQIGRDYHKELSKKYNVYKDERVTRLANKVAEVSGVHHVQFFAIDMGRDDQPNAFQTPGHIYVTRSLLNEFDDIALTYILGHEMGHEVRNHLKGRIRKVRDTSILATLAGAILGVRQNTVGDYALNIGAGYMINQHSQSNELEADVYGLEVLHDLGIPFEEAAEAFRQLAGNRSESRTLNTLFGSHPIMRDRISRTAGADDVLKMRPVDVYEYPEGNIAVIWEYTADKPMKAEHKELRQKLQEEMEGRGYKLMPERSPRVWAKLSILESLDAKGLRDIGDAFYARWIMSGHDIALNRGEFRWKGNAIDTLDGTNIVIEWRFRDAAGLADYFDLSIKNILSGMFADKK